MIYEELLIAIVIVSYIIVIVTTFKGRKTTRELEGLVSDLKLKEVQKIKSAIAPAEIHFARTVESLRPEIGRTVPAPGRTEVGGTGPAELMTPKSGERRIVREKIVTRSRTIEESKPGISEIRSAVEQKPPDAKGSTKTVEIEIEEPAEAPLERVERAGAGMVTVRTAQAGAGRSWGRPQPVIAPKVQMEERRLSPIMSLIDNKMNKTELKSQFIKSRGKLSTTLDEQYRKGVISQKTYEELLKRSELQGAEMPDAELAKLEETQKKTRNLLLLLKEQYEKGIISSDTYNRSKATAESKLREIESKL